MTEALLLPHTGPFVTALLVCFIMLALAAVGIGGDGDAGPDLDTGGPDLDIDTPGADGISADVEAELDAAVDSYTAESAETGDTQPAAQTSPVATALGLLNPGGVPMGVLIALFAGGYGVTGMLAQKAADAWLGAPISPTLAGLALLPAGVASTRGLGRLIARLIPSVETAAVTAGQLKGAQAEISLGTAEVGRPARARVADRHVGGQVVNVEVVPYRKQDGFPAGTQVVLLERTRDGVWVAGRLPASASQTDPK